MQRLKWASSDWCRELWKIKNFRQFGGERIWSPFISPFFPVSNKVGHISPWRWPPNHHGLNQMVDYVPLKTIVPEALRSRHREKRGEKKEGSENDCGSAGGPMLMNRWCGRGKVKPVRVGVSGTPCCVDRCADGRSSSPACSAKPVACVQNALIYPSLFFVIFGLAYGQPNCVSLRKITSSPLCRICSPPCVLRNNVAEFCVTLGSMWQWCKNVKKEPNMGFCSHCQGA